ncbi:MAG: cytidylate kinase-like family protein [Spirochaeta sp.]|jgi:cytidylate kinase|nr:cytidylate kinase-like family protein [Spirochaeta sp.]
MALITVSRQSGSRGEEITDLLARTLGLRLIDKQTLESVLVRHGVPETNVERYDEKKPGFWDLFSTERDRYYHYLKASIFETARDGNQIILGRGAPVILGEVPGVLHLRIIAPLETRVQRLMEERGCDEVHARKLVHRHDHDRSGFYHVYFNVDWDSAELYDLTFNTTKVTPEMVVSSVESLIAAPSFSDAAKHTEERLTELATAQQILTRIIFQEKIPLRFPAVEVHGGTAVISGAVTVCANVDRCSEIARAAEGIDNVESRIACVPENYDGAYM